jgi:hypothetical protein
VTRIELLAHLLSGAAHATCESNDWSSDRTSERVVEQANRIADLVLADPQVVAEREAIADHASKRGRS